jgi:hypothetical protein
VIAAIELNWPQLLAGGLLFQAAGLAQVFHRKLPVPLFFAAEAVTAFVGSTLAGLGVTHNIWFSVVFAGLFTILVMGTLVGLWKVLYGQWPGTGTRVSQIEK